MKSIFWFRKDLRFSDNTALANALIESDEVYPIFILNDHILNGPRSCKARNYFLKKSLEELSPHITILQGDYIQILNDFIKKHNIDRIYINKDYSPYSKSRDKKLKSLEIEIKTYKDLTIFEDLEINTNGRPYIVFTPFKNKFLSILTPDHYKNFTLKKEYYDKIKTDQSINIDQIISDDCKDIVENSPFIPGEKAAQEALDKFIKEKILDYKEKRDFPSIEGTSQISAHLHFGTLSIRNCFRKALELNDKRVDSWVSELIWREFYYSILSNYPEVTNKEYQPKYRNLKWSNDEVKFKAWCEGKTGYPIVDAAMRCLNKTGWMHNRLRMITASFLIKDLHIDWRLGEKYFINNLIDGDLASNNGGWQWAASTGTDATPYFRIFSPIEQTKRFDKEKEFIRKWTDLDLKPIVDHSVERKIAIDMYKQI